jgi:hypothetical protein
VALRDLLDEAVAQVVPFDGKTAASVRAAKSKPASLPQPGQPSKRFVPMKNPAQAMQPVAPKPMPQVKVPSIRDSVERVGTQWGLGAVRSLVGLGQGLSGVADLASPGEGTSRVSKKLDQFARFTDDTAAQEAQHAPTTDAAKKSLNLAYKGAQASTDAFTSAATGGMFGAASEAAKTAPVIRQATRLIAPIANRTDKALQVLDKGNVGQRVAATAARTLHPVNVVNMGAQTGLDLGAEASKGRNIDGGDIARSLGTNLAVNTGAPVAARLVSEGAQAVRPLVRPAVDATVDAVQHGAQAVAQRTNDLATAAFNVKPHRQIDDAFVDAASRVRAVQQGHDGEIDPADYELYDRLRQHLGGDINDPTRMDRIIQDRRVWAEEGRKRVMEREQAIAKAQASKQGGFVKLPGRMTPEDAPEPIGAVIQQRRTKLVPPKPQQEQLPIDVPPAPPMQPPEPAALPSRPGVVENRLTKRGKAGEQPLAPEVMENIQGEHNVRNTQQLADRNKAAFDAQGQDEAIQGAYDRLNVPEGHVTDEDVAYASQAIIQAQRAGRMEDAVNIHDMLSEQLVATGRANQAATILYNMTPEGMYYKARRDLTRSGTQLTPELETRLQEQAGRIAEAPDDATKTAARAEFGKTVADNLSKSSADKLLSVWKAGLLSGQKTFQGNLFSNGTFGVAKKIADLPASLVDQAIGMFTGERTKTATLRGLPSGTVEGTRKGLKTMRTGVDERDIVDKTGKFEGHGELNFKNPVINAVFGKTTNMVFRTLSSADQPFYYAAAKNSLYDQALAAAKNQGLSGDDARRFVKNAVDNPSNQMAEIAKRDADRAVLGYDTIGSKAIQGIHTSIDKLPDNQFSKAAKATAHSVVGVLAPFVKVPTAFISRTIDFTPAGVLKTAIGQMSHGKFDQRALSEAIGEGTTGTGVIALGVALAQNHLLSGDYPKNDPKEAARWKAEGITPNSIKLGDKWFSLNYLGPVGLLFNAGRQMEQGEDGAAAGIAQAAAGLGQGLMGQSFLQGFSGFSDAIQDPERSAKSFVNSQASSVIPAWMNDIANATDEYQRQVDTVPEAMKNRIPGARIDNKIKQDVYGNKLKQADGQANTLNALKPSDNMTDKSPAVAEVARLHAVDPKNKDLQVTPNQVDKKLSVDGQEVKLDNDQRYELQEKVGQATQERWNQLVATPEYQKLNDTDKAKALVGLRQASQELATREYVETKGLATYKDKMSSGARRLQANGNISRFAKPSDGDGEISFADKYDDAQAEWQADSKDWSPVKKAKKQHELRQLKVQKDFDTDTVSLYGMSKDDVYALVSSDPDGNRMVQKLLAYGDAQAAAGLSSTNKFRDKKGNEAIRPKERGSGSGGSDSFSLYSGAANPLKYDKTLRQLVDSARLS